MKKLIYCNNHNLRNVKKLIVIKFNKLFNLRNRRSNLKEKPVQEIKIFLTLMKFKIIKI
jgi:hypothetical protein